jgi:hypothetical protein
MIEDMPNLISTLGLLWERYNMSKAHREERTKDRAELIAAIKDFTHSINDLNAQIIKLNERCKGLTN